MALRQLALGDPLDYLNALASPDAQDWLERNYFWACDRCPGRPDFRQEELHAHCRRVGDFPCAIVEMSPPRAMTEAYFTALVLLAELPLPRLTPQESFHARYFTLEYGLSLEGSPETVLGEWNSDGTHFHLGQGPEPTVEAFLAAIEGQLASA